MESGANGIIIAEDEAEIGRGYRDMMSYVWMALPLLTACVADTKWVLAVSFAIALPILHEIMGKTNELCIRLRRTNSLILDNGRISK